MNHTCLFLPSRSWYSFIDARRMEGWVGLVGWLHTEINVHHWEWNSDMVTHPSTNWARCRLTLLIETMHYPEYNFQCKGTVQLSRPPLRSRAPVHFMSPCFNSGLSNYQLSTECIKHDFMLFFQFCCKSIRHCEFMTIKVWNLNDSLTIGLL